MEHSGVVGFLIDFAGRRLSIIVNAVIFLVGAAILAAAPSFSVLVSDDCNPNNV